jgi:hypothetical protein
MTALFIALLAALRATIRSRLEFTAEISRGPTSTRRAATDHPETIAPRTIDLAQIVVLCPERRAIL